MRNDGIFHVRDLFPDGIVFKDQKLGDPNAPRPTWDELVAAEPQLGDLLRRARTPIAGGWSDALRFIWYGEGGIRAAIPELVGWYAQSDNPVLHGSAAYEVAMDTIYWAFNDCQPGEIDETADSEDDR